MYTSRFRLSSSQQKVKAQTVEQTVPLMLNTAEEALNRLKMPMKPMLISLLPRMRSALPTSSPEDRASRFMFHRLERLERDGILRSNLKG